MGACAAHELVVHARCSWALHCIHVFVLHHLLYTCRRAQLQASGSGAPAFASPHITHVRRTAARERCGVMSDPPATEAANATPLTFTVPPLVRLEML